MREFPEGSPAGRIVEFGRLLKDNGFLVSPPCVLDACTGISRVGVENLRDFKAVLKATFMTRREETPAFERLFTEFWLNRGIEPEITGMERREPQEGAPGDDEAISEESTAIAEAGVSDSQERQAWESRPLVMYSPSEILRKQDFKDVPEGNDARMDRLIREIVSPLLRRAGVRRRPSISGAQVDFRKMLRRNLRHGGDIVELPRARPKLRLKKLVFLCDVSGSMNPYLRFMLRFIKEIQQLPTKVETFVFATRLTRITQTLLHLPFSRALKEISGNVADWSGGTRIGSCLEKFTSVHGGSMLRPSTVVIIHSDGWDRGEPELLDRELTKIRRRSYRIIWINPLLGGPSYEPTCRGMRIALPHLDAFLAGHNIAGLERVAGTVRALL